MWYKQLPVSNNEKEVIDNLFTNLKVVSVDNYKNRNWKVLYFHSRPFMEESIYQKFVELMSFKEFVPVSIFSYPFTHRTKFLCVEKAPNSYREFYEVMEQTNYLYTGGFGFSQNEKFAFVSNADTEIFSIACDMDAFPPEIEFVNIPQWITKDEAMKLTKAHLDFLNPLSEV